MAEERLSVDPQSRIDDVSRVVCDRRDSESNIPDTSGAGTASLAACASSGRIAAESENVNNGVIRTESLAVSGAESGEQSIMTVGAVDALSDAVIGLSP